MLTAAFGLVAALAWNAAIQALITEFISKDNGLIGQFVYAIIVTVIAVVMTLLIARSIGKLKEADSKE